jgi:hypothetical protein
MYMLLGAWAIAALVVARLAQLVLFDDAHRLVALAVPRPRRLALGTIRGG